MRAQVRGRVRFLGEACGVHPKIFRQTVFDLGAAIHVGARLHFASLVSHLLRRIAAQEIEPLFACSYVLYDETALLMSLRTPASQTEPQTNSPEALAFAAAIFGARSKRRGGVAGKLERQLLKVSCPSMCTRTRGPPRSSSHPLGPWFCWLLLGFGSGAKGSGGAPLVPRYVRKCSETSGDVRNVRTNAVGVGPSTANARHRSHAAKISGRSKCVPRLPALPTHHPPPPTHLPHRDRRPSASPDSGRALVRGVAPQQLAPDDAATDSVRACFRQGGNHRNVRSVMGVGSEMFGYRRACNRNERHWRGCVRKCWKRVGRATNVFGNVGGGFGNVGKHSEMSGGRCAIGSGGAREFGEQPVDNEVPQRLLRRSSPGSLFKLHSSSFRRRHGAHGR